MFFCCSRFPERQPRQPDIDRDERKHSDDESMALQAHSPRARHTVRHSSLIPPDIPPGPGRPTAHQVTRERYPLSFGPSDAVLERAGWHPVRLFRPRLRANEPEVRSRIHLGNLADALAYSAGLSRPDIHVMDAMLLAALRAPKKGRPFTPTVRAYVIAFAKKLRRNTVLISDKHHKVLICGGWRWSRTLNLAEFDLAEHARKLSARGVRLSVIVERVQDLGDTSYEFALVDTFTSAMEHLPRELPDLRAIAAQRSAMPRHQGVAAEEDEEGDLAAARRMEAIDEMLADAGLATGNTGWTDLAGVLGHMVGMDGRQMSTAFEDWRIKYATEGERFREEDGALPMEFDIAAFAAENGFEILFLSSMREQALGLTTSWVVHSLDEEQIPPLLVHGMEVFDRPMVMVNRMTDEGPVFQVATPVDAPRPREYVHIDMRPARDAAGGPTPHIDPPTGGS